MLSGRLNTATNDYLFEMVANKSKFFSFYPLTWNFTLANGSGIQAISAEILKYDFIILFTL